MSRRSEKHCQQCIFMPLADFLYLSSGFCVQFWPREVSFERKPSSTTSSTCCTGRSLNMPSTSSMLLVDMFLHEHTPWQALDNQLIPVALFTVETGLNVMVLQWFFSVSLFSTGTLTVCTCWSCCSTSTSGKSWLMPNVPNSSMNSSYCTGSTTPGNACVCSRHLPSSSSRSSSHCRMAMLPPNDEQTVFCNLIYLNL